MILTTKNIHKKYQQGASSLHILKGVHLEIDEGDVLALVGPSGAGKSTHYYIENIFECQSKGRSVSRRENKI